MGSDSSDAPHWPQYGQRTSGPISHDTINANHELRTGGCRSIADAAGSPQYRPACIQRVSPFFKHQHGSARVPGDLWQPAGRLPVSACVMRV